MLEELLGIGGDGVVDSELMVVLVMLGLRWVLVLKEMETLTARYPSNIEVYQFALGRYFNATSDMAAKVAYGERSRLPLLEHTRS